jgi:hypothetical protein
VRGFRGISPIESAGKVGADALDGIAARLAEEIG